MAESPPCTCTSTPNSLYGSVTPTGFTSSPSPERTSNSSSSSVAETHEPLEPKHFDLLTPKDGVCKLKEHLIGLCYGLSDLVWEVDSDSSVLHIAARAGDAIAIRDILNQCAPLDDEAHRGHRGLLLRGNKEDDLPIHVAVKAGRKEAVNALIVEASDDKTQLEKVNKAGNTALHIALENQEAEIAKLLYEKTSSSLPCDMFNAQGACPLYLAIKARFWDIVALMLSSPNFTNQVKPDPLQRGFSVVHAAIEARNKETLRCLLENDEFSISLDKKRRTPLSYAALVGFVEGVEILLKKHSQLAYIQDGDEDASFPIHNACIGGDIEVVKRLLSHHRCYAHCLRNNKKQNILHVAAMFGKTGVVKYLSGRTELKELINMRDEEGNTPLHLATLGKHAKVVHALARNKRANVTLVNEKGQTALDLIEACQGGRQARSFEERLIWLALIYADVPRRRVSSMDDWGTQMVSRGKCCPAEYKRQGAINHSDNRINTLVMVSVLVVTVTFAAGFTLPGGYITSTGTATLAHKRAFQAFVISNSVAMFTSIFASVTLIWASLDDLKLSLTSLKLALPALCISLTMMLVAFVMGLFAVLYTQCFWLAIAVLGLGTVFLLVVLATFIPLFCRTTCIRNGFERCFFNLLLRFMLKMLPE